MRKKKQSKIDSIFKRKRDETSEGEITNESTMDNQSIPVVESNSVEPGNTLIP